MGPPESPYQGRFRIGSSFVLHRHLWWRHKNHFQLPLLEPRVVVTNGLLLEIEAVAECLVISKLLEKVLDLTDCLTEVTALQVGATT